MATKGLLERLDAGEIVVGDGGFVFALEKRGYVKAGPWTPEAVVDYPEAVSQLHREFARAGADVMQAFTFYASDDKLKNRGNKLSADCKTINTQACKLARDTARANGLLFAGGVCQTPTYLTGVGKKATQEHFKQQFDVFVEEKVDFLIVEYFEHVEEAEWAIEEAKKTGLPICASLCINKETDLHGVPTSECGVRLAKAGANVVGINCHFDPFMSVDAVKEMIRGVKENSETAKMNVHFMVQPLAYMTTDSSKQGFIDFPEFPFGLEPRINTRMEIAKYARLAYDAGIRYIGGCCGFEPYHIRAVSEELAKERGKLPEASEKHLPWGQSLIQHTKPWVRARCTREYWEKVKYGTGRPTHSAFSEPENWNVTQGHEFLKQQENLTTDEELKKLKARQAQK